MEIESFAHKGLRRLYEDDDASKIDPASTSKIKTILAFLEAMNSPNELKMPPKWKAHQLTGDRKGIWSLFVTANYRLTFVVDKNGALRDLNLEDYH